jgi:hypothetical protein
MKHKEAMEYDCDSIKRSSFVNANRRRQVTSSSSGDSSVPERDMGPFQALAKLDKGRGLFIFAEKDAYTDQVVFHLNTNETTIATKESPVWSTHFAQELSDAQVNLPANGFEEMISLTDQGQLWKFPIDNEQGELFVSAIKMENQSL